ncbi:MAG: carboxypeptidase M32 [Planctomycetales bacterium]|nr:carboxypeptidase M32 [Planctomycetales bacterium]
MTSKTETSAAPDAYAQLVSHARETGLFAGILGLLDWDERTKMPQAAGPHRADQIAFLAGQIHRRQTDPRLGELLGELAATDLAADPHSDAGANIRLLQRDYDKKTRLPQELVEELSRLSVLGQQVWSAARADDDFPRFLPVLEQTIALKRQEAAALGYDDTPYDALLDEYEPGESTANVARALGGLRDALAPLVEQIVGSQQGPSNEIMLRDFPKDAQEAFGIEAAAAIGFDFAAGRLDDTVHPFCATAGPRDVRLTTRYNERDFGDAFFSILHEAGHGLYEQGLLGEHCGLPIGEATSLGVHESQSRMWENQVGRSRAFWRFMTPKAQQHFPAALAGVSAEDMYRAVNTVAPSLIRVDADEVTYNLHICIRFDLEKQLIEGDLAARDLPEAWRAAYQRLLGVTPPNDAQGVLQDVHWSGGSFGYFPTYALGNLYAAQFFAQAARDLGDLDEQFARGEFQPLLDWLRTKIHRHGRRYSAAELAQRITGKPLSHDDWLAQNTAKYGELYQL